MKSTSKRFLIASFIVFSFVFANSTAPAQDQVYSILSVGGGSRSTIVSDAVTTWLENSTVAPCWQMMYRLRIPSSNGVLAEISAGFSYFESNTWNENGTPLGEGRMRIFLLEAPIGIGSSIPVLGPLLLTGSVQAIASYRELGWVASESGAVQMADFTLDVNGHWGFAIRLTDGSRIFLLADLLSGIPISGQTSYPSREIRSYDRWTVGMGASTVLELLVGPLFARASANVYKGGEARFTSLASSIGVEGMFTTEIRLGLELGVRF